MIYPIPSEKDQLRNIFKDSNGFEVYKKIINEYISAIQNNKPLIRKINTLTIIANICLIVLVLVIVYFIIITLFDINTINVLSLL